MRSARYPVPLAPGSRVALVSPSGPLAGEADLERAEDNVASFGWEPVVGDHVLERDGYLAGSDACRVADLNRFINDRSIDGIWCIRGGYGATRLLPDLDYESWLQRPLTLIGYSDITALHAALGQAGNVITYHGPTARAELTDTTRSSFADALSLRAGDHYVIHDDAMSTLLGGTTRGRLVGGNLALVAALVGTSYQWQMDGAILVLEDVAEQVYRLDRMLTQLRQSGALARVAGIAFGKFTEIPDDGTAADRPLQRVLQEVADAAGVPCVMNFPIGHVADHVTLPLGAVAELDADNATLTICHE